MKHEKAAEMYNPDPLWSVWGVYLTPAKRPSRKYFSTVIRCPVDMIETWIPIKLMQEQPLRKIKEIADFEYVKIPEGKDK